MSISIATGDLLDSTERRVKEVISFLKNTPCMGGLDPVVVKIPQAVFIDEDDDGGPIRHASPAYVRRVGKNVEVTTGGVNGPMYHITEWFDA